MNKVILMGRIATEPEIKTTSSKRNVLSFQLAVRRKHAKEGQQADFFKCIAWQQKADFINKYFDKGDMIAIEGRIQNRIWEGDDGTKQHTTEIIVEKSHFTGEKHKNTNQQEHDSSSQQSIDTDINDFMDLNEYGDELEDDLPF